MSLAGKQTADPLIQTIVAGARTLITVMGGSRRPLGHDLAGDLINGDHG